VSWTFRWDMTALYSGAFNIGAAASLRTITAATAGGAITLPMFAGVQTAGFQQIYVRGGPTSHPTFDGIGYARCFLFCPLDITIHWVENGVGRFTLTGTEVSRVEAVVPEPATGTMFALGLAGVVAAGGRTGWRRHQRQRD